MAGELQAVMVKNPKKARHTCTREYRQQRAAEQPPGNDEGDVQAPAEVAAPDAAMVWEIS